MLMGTDAWFADVILVIAEGGCSKYENDKQSSSREGQKFSPQSEAQLYGEVILERGTLVHSKFRFATIAQSQWPTPK